MIMQLGSVPIYAGKVENYKEHLDLLKPFIDDDSYWRQTSEWMSLTQSTMGHEKNTELPWDKILPDLDKHFQWYLDIFKPRAQFGIQTRPWLNRYEKGGWQEQHNHLGSHAHFSMAYMIDTQDQQNFIFSDQPGNWHDYMGIGHLFENWPERSFVPDQESGTILIFPSALDHFVMPNKSDEYRITASANFYLFQE
jgi:hypothetical protein